MATQICPNCKNDSFTWSVDFDESQLTKWGCSECYYRAWEDESTERMCSNCNKKTESLLKDETKTYWWCSHCNKVTIV